MTVLVVRPSNNNDNNKDADALWWLIVAGFTSFTFHPPTPTLSFFSFFPPHGRLLSPVASPAGQAKGFTAEQLQETLHAYEELNIWRLNATRTKVFLVNG